MADITTLPVMTAADAESIGFARFNDVPTLPVDIPDGNFTITAKTSDGRRVTFFFGEHKRGAPPSFVDIQYHGHEHRERQRRHLADLRDADDRPRRPTGVRQPQARCR